MLSCYLPLTFTLGRLLILRCWPLNWYEKSRTDGSAVLVRLLQFTQNHKFVLIFPVCSHHLCMVDQDVKVSRQQKGMYLCRDLLHCCVSLPVFPHLFQFPSLVLYGFSHSANKAGCESVFQSCTQPDRDSSTKSPLKANQMYISK